MAEGQDKENEEPDGAHMGKMKSKQAAKPNEHPVGPCGTAGSIGKAKAGADQVFQWIKFS